MDLKAQLAELLLTLDYSDLHDFAYRLNTNLGANLDAGDIAEAILETAQDIA